MKKKTIRIALATLLLTVLVPVGVFADDTQSGEFASNVYSAGLNANVNNAQAKDIFCAGQTISVNSSEAQGNIFVAGQGVAVESVYAGADVIVAGQSISVSDAAVEGNFIAAGQDVVVDGNVDSCGVIIAAADVSYSGTCDEVYISADKIEFNGTANGDVKLAGTDVIIGEGAQIAGKLTVLSSKEPDISESSQMGEYVFNLQKNTEEDVKEGVAAAGIFAKMLKKLVSRLYWIPAMVLFGLLLCLLFGKNVDEAKDMIKSETTPMVLSGAIGWIAVPIVALLVAITFIGLPIAGMLMTAYVLLLLAGLTFAGASLGRLAFNKLNPYLASVIGIAILEAVRIVPIIGGLIAVAADMYLIGYVINKIIDSIKDKKKVVYATAVEEPIMIEDKETVSE